MRAAIIVFTSEVLAGLLRLPSGVRITDARSHDRFGSLGNIQFRIEGESLPAVTEGNALPVVTLGDISADAPKVIHANPH